MKTALLLFLVPLMAPTGAPELEIADPQAAPVEAQLAALAEDVNDLERRVRRLSSDLEDRADTGLVLFLFGAFCALWAKNSGRGPWLWFFLGALFNVITVVVLLSKNAGDWRTREERGQASP